MTLQKTFRREQRNFLSMGETQTAMSLTQEQSLPSWRGSGILPINSVSHTSICLAQAPEHKSEFKREAGRRA